MKEEYFSVELPLSFKEFSSIYMVVCCSKKYPIFPKDANEGYINEFDSHIIKGVRYFIKKTKVGFVYRCFGNSGDQYFVILNKEGQISPLMEEGEIMEHFKFVEAENVPA